MDTDLITSEQKTTNPQTQMTVTNVEAFKELKQKQIEVAKSLIQAKGLLEQKKKEKRKSELTISELLKLPDNSEAYKGVGRMFLMTEMNSLKTEISSNIEKNDKEIIELDEKQKYLTQKSEEIEKDINELIVPLKK